MSLKNINTSPKLIEHLVASGAFSEKCLLVVDVGARGGFEKHWSWYGDQVKLFGFEADTKECERLNRQNTQNGNRFFPTALHRDRGRKPFYITAYTSSSGFFQPDAQKLQRFPDRVNLSVVQAVEMDTTDFDSFARENNIDYVDFMKLDAEGLELEIMKGATGFLDTSVIGLSIEVWFQQMHIDQPVFSEVDLFLRQHGFTLFDLSTNRIGREALPVPTISPVPGPVDTGQISTGQALYLRDAAPEIGLSVSGGIGWNDVRVLKLASIMELFCLQDCAVELLQVSRKNGLLHNWDVDKLVDLLVPQVNNKRVSYKDYLAYVDSIRRRGFMDNIQHGKQLARGLLPVFARRSMAGLLTKTRNFIDSILK
jgi:FkbM family methyltransferase